MGEEGMKEGMRKEGIRTEEGRREVRIHTTHNI
jgi:hypothetical protein